MRMRKIEWGGWGGDAVKRIVELWKMCKRKKRSGKRGRKTPNIFRAPQQFCCVFFFYFYHHHRRCNFNVRHIFEVWPTAHHADLQLCCCSPFFSLWFEKMYGICSRAPLNWNVSHHHNACTWIWLGKGWALDRKRTSGWRVLIFYFHPKLNHRTRNRFSTCIFNQSVPVDIRWLEIIGLLIGV